MLDSNGEAWAATGEKPLRYMTWGFGCGVITKWWNPSKTGFGGQWELSDALKPLAQWKDYLLHVSAVNVKGAASHGNGNISLLTSTQSAREQGPPDGNAGPTDWERIKQYTRIKSLEVSISDNQDDRTLGHLYYSHNGLRSPNKPMHDPAKVFDRLFGGGEPSKSGDPAAMERAQHIREMKKSVLDFVTEDAKRLKSDLPARERPRLERHLDAIRDVEKELAGGSGAGAGRKCEVPGRPGSTRKAPPTFEGSRKLNAPMAKLVALAWACDLTRVVTYQTTQPASRASWKEGGINSWHGTSHDGSENGKKFHKGVVEHMRWLKTLVEELYNTPDGSKNLLDNSVIMTVNDVGQGFTHQSTEMPTLLIGKAGEPEDERAPQAWRLEWPLAADDRQGPRGGHSDGRQGRQRKREVLEGLLPPIHETDSRVARLGDALSSRASWIHPGRDGGVWPPALLQIPGAFVYEGAQPGQFCRLEIPR